MFFTLRNKISAIALSLFLLVMGLGISPLMANDVSVVAMVDQNRMELGSVFNFTLKINGVQNVDPIKLPEIEGLESSFLGPSTRISIVNGQYSKSVALNYNMYPIKVGKFEIPALNVEIDGNTYKTQSIPIEIVDPGGQESDPQGGTSSQPIASLQDKIFIVMGAPKNEYYVNERIPITVKLLVNDLKISEIQYPQFAHAGFTMEPFPEPPSYQKVIAGIPYNIWEFKTFIYPNRTGQLSLGPAQLKCNIVFKNNQRRRTSRGSFGSIFDDNFFDGFFDTYTKREITLESADLAFKIKPLPEEGKPEDFSGAVGSFDMDVSVGPKEVRVGDPLTLKIKVAGSGNLKALTMPSMGMTKGIEGKFKYYDPQVTEVGRIKSLEQIVIPLDESVKEFPSISFNFFDVASQQYKTLMKGPFPIKVVPLEADEQMKVVGLEPGDNRMITPEQLGQDISFIKERMGKVYGEKYLLYKKAGIYVLFVFTLLAWVGGVVAYRITHRIKTDVQFARRLQAPRHARRGLVTARKFLERGEQVAFYDALFKTLQKYFAYKFHIPAGSVNIKNISKLVADRQLESSLTDQVRSVFDDCEAVRYASITFDKHKMNASFHQAEEIIDTFERKWR